MADSGEGQHLLAERFLDQRQLPGPVTSQGFAEPFGVVLDVALAAGSLEGSSDLCSGQVRGFDGGGRQLEELACFGSAQAVGPGGEGVPGVGVVLAQWRPELVGDLLPVPGRVLLGAG
ncbi:hypothetical protein SBI_00013 [Streptomyces bingchenggensis BCW-1]|uniref:Uncharacterized protein n=1 Tax=Streptomyces bingchenggensis (strain BCW-1) TaxID=749414 RepID=D7BSV7_STRBB|nr:hypothetical protein SBI_00013 [Streptomyces bingchenggensis BCW-1]